MPKSIIKVTALLKELVIGLTVYVPLRTARQLHHLVLVLILKIVHGLIIHAVFSQNAPIIHPPPTQVAQFKEMDVYNQQQLMEQDLIVQMKPPHNWSNVLH